MVDTTARRRYAEALRHFAADVIDNAEFQRRENEIFETAEEDAGLWAVKDETWCLYSDFRTHYLELAPEGRKELARWVLFLYSDEEYAWPSWTTRFSLSTCLLNLLTLGLWGRITAPAYERKIQALGDPKASPFLTGSRFEDAKRNVRLLGRALPQQP